MNHVQYNKIRKIGLLGGSFDPMHFGHINLGLEMQERHALDEVIICPAAASPFKTEQSPQVSGEQRMRMACLGTEGLKNWRVIDWELKRGDVSYTIDTVLALHEEAERKKEKIALYLLLGQDILRKLAEWKDIKKILTLASPLIGVRDPREVSLELPPFIEPFCQRGMTTTRNFEISSTSVRERLKKRLYCGHLVPAKILDFIYHHQLYLH
jgi:nicotinate-nucleotide adenylyltransferase